MDSNSKTPRMLAVGRRHKTLVKFLDTRDASNLWDWRYVAYYVFMYVCTYVYVAYQACACLSQQSSDLSLSIGWKHSTRYTSEI